MFERLVAVMKTRMFPVWCLWQSGLLRQSMKLFFAGSNPVNHPKKVSRFHYKFKRKITVQALISRVQFIRLTAWSRVVDAGSSSRAPLSFRVNEKVNNSQLLTSIKVR